MSSTLRGKATAWLALVLGLASSAIAQGISVSCWDDLAKQTGCAVHTKRFPIVSNGKGRDAYVETTAKPVKDPSGDCANTSRLFVRQAGQPFQLVYITRPSTYLLGNDLQIVGWSGDLLLLNDRDWQYASDYDSNKVVIYNAMTGTFATPDLAKLVAQQLKVDCELRAVARGWEAGHVAFEVSEAAVDLDDDQRCLRGKPALWTFDLKAKQVAPK
jgi:hypothetical protein